MGAARIRQPMPPPPSLSQYSLRQDFSPLIFQKKRMCSGGAGRIVYWLVSKVSPWLFFFRRGRFPSAPRELLTAWFFKVANVFATRLCSVGPDLWSVFLNTYVLSSGRVCLHLKGEKMVVVFLDCLVWLRSRSVAFMPRRSSVGIK